MKTVTIKTLAAGLVASVLLFGACKKPEAGPAGKDGAAGANGVVPMSSDGYIKGNVTGTRQDGTPFNEAFDYRKYWGQASGTIDSITTSMYQVSIDRGVDIFGSNYAGLSIMMSSKAATTGTLNMYFNYEKSLGANKVFRFSTTGTATTIVTGITYNAGTGLYSGTFNCGSAGMNNTSGNTAMITGSFQATISEIVNIIKTTDNTIKD